MMVILNSLPDISNIRFRSDSCFVLENVFFLHFFCLPHNFLKLGILYMPVETEAELLCLDTSMPFLLMNAWCECLN